MPEVYQIIYPFAAGGNHLATLLSTHNNFYPKFYSENYFEDLLIKYEKNLNRRLDASLFATINKHLTIDSMEDVLGRLSLYYNAHFWEGHPMTEFTINNCENFLEIIINYKGVKFYVSVPEEEFYTSDFTKNFISQTHNYDHAVIDVPKNKLVKKLWHTMNLEHRKGIIMTYPKNEGRAGQRVFVANSKVNFNNSYKNNYKLPYFRQDIELFNDMNALLVDTNLFCEDDGSRYLQELLKSKFQLQLPDIIHDLHTIWCKMVDKSIALAENK